MNENTYKAILLTNADQTAVEYGNTNKSGSASKLPGSITLSTNTVTLDYTNTTATVTMDVVGDGQVYVVSSDDTVCNASIVDGSVVITGEFVGSASAALVTVTLEDGAAYTGATATITVSNSLIAVSWANGTDAAIAAMVAAADAGLIDLYEDAGWRVGDERTTTLAAIAQSGTYDGVSWTVNDAQSEQQVTLVLMHQGGYQFVTPVKDKQGQNRQTCSFVVGLKNGLSITGYMNQTYINFGSWHATARRDWCNGGFRQAINSTLRPAFKRFNCITGTWNNQATGGSNITTQDYFALAAEKEVFGSRTQSTDTEANALFQFTWYQTSSNRIKTQGDKGSAYYWWERSPQYNNSRAFCAVATDGAAMSSNAGNTHELSPFGCI